MINLFFAKGQGKSGEGKVLSTAAERMEELSGKATNLDLWLLSDMKITSKWNINLNMRSETRKL